MENKRLEIFHLVPILIICFFFTGLCVTSFAQESQIAGTFFGEPVPSGNYYFLLKVVLSYGSPWGNIPQDRTQLEQRLWDELILSYEANRRQISVSESELQEKISETLNGEHVAFQWKQNPGEYARWVQERIGGSVNLFENQMRHLVQVKKLYDEVLSGINPSVTEDEAFQEFLNEQNSLSVELAEFDNLEDAQSFYQKVIQDKSFWEQKTKENKAQDSDQRQFRKPGFVTLEYLMDMWGFPKKALYEMMEMEKGAVYPPTPIYKGFGVYKILDSKKADGTQFSGRKQGYIEQLEYRKRYNGFENWLRNLRDKADIQIFMEPPPELLL